MSSQPNQSVEVRLKLVVDKDGVRAVDVLTGRIVAAARAEDTLAEAVKRRAAAQRAASVAQRVGGVLEQHRQATWERHQQKQVANDLAAMGRNADGTRMSAYDRLAGRGSAAAGRLGLTGREVAGGAAAAVAVAARTGGGYAEFGRIDADPWMTERQKLEAKARANPFVGRAYGLFKDVQETWTGERQLLGRFERAQAESAVRVQGRSEVDALRQRLGYERQSQAERAVAFNGVPSLLPGGAGRFGGLTLDRPDPGIDRTTAQGRREYENEARLLPLRQQATRAAVERAAAEEKVRRLTADEAARLRAVGDAERRAAVFRDQRTRADQDRSGVDRSGAKAGSAGAAGVERDSLDLARAARDRYQEAVQARKDAQVDLVRKRSDEDRSQTAIAREQAAVTQDRYARSVGGAAALSELGLGGRELAKQGLRLLQQGVRPDELPDDIRAAVGQAAPTALAEANEKSGEQFKGEFRAIRPDLDEFKPADPLRKEADQARERATGLEEKGLRDLEGRLAGVLTKGYEDALVAAVKRATEAAVQRLELDQFMRNATGNQ